MAINTHKRQSPTLDVPACAGAHVSGELCMELGRIGVATNSNAVGGQNNIQHHGVHVLPVAGAAGAIAGGTAVYAVGTAFVNGSTVQAFAPTYRGTAVAGTLTATATANTLVGKTNGASYADGATVVAEIELAPQS